MRLGMTYPHLSFDAWIGSTLEPVEDIDRQGEEYIPFAFIVC